MRLLALDASLRQCSAALLDDASCLDERRGDDSRAAAAALPGMVAALLGSHAGRLDAIGVTIGPGSFTGLRAALAFAHGLALGAGVPVIGVTVAEALLAASPDASAWVALDTRRPGRVFLGRDGAMAAVALDALPRPPGAVRLIGDAAEAVAAVLRAAGADAVAVGGVSLDPAMVGLVALRRLRGELPRCDAQPLYIEQPQMRATPSARPALA